ncbi:MAG: uncharacterized protein KVP18_001022 [Porospora cf. gigantea A]|uniref:uncharacterized protein n=1 Tax=Porospora cf. gigantea A TaxID=2853593 RepID=UPI00355A9885|nr:MAG: hypothetical protein KVP18_001022 [Porospora cf. gigantea A]
MTCAESKTAYEFLVGTEVGGVTVHHNAYEGTHEHGHENRCDCTAGFEQASDRSVCEDIKECRNEDCDAHFMSGGAKIPLNRYLC